MDNLKKKYRDLEMQTHARLRNQLNNSKYISEFTNGKAIKIDIGSKFKELALIDDRIYLLDANGYNYNLNVINLENLIELTRN